MPGPKLFPILRHAVKMIGRTLKSYALLSVTIVLTFSLFLGYLLYTDSTAYNRYKDILSQPREKMHFYDHTMGVKKLGVFLEKASEIGKTSLSIVYHCGIQYNFILENTYQKNDPDSVEDDICYEYTFLDLYALPDHTWVGDIPIDAYDMDRITWLDGREAADITLAEDEVILPEEIYRLLGMDKMEQPLFTLPVSYHYAYTLRVVGVLKDPAPLTVDVLEVGKELEYGEYSYFDEKGNQVFPPIGYTENRFGHYYREANGFRLLVSQKLLNPETMPMDSMDADSWSRYVYIHTDSPEQVHTLADSLGYQMREAVYERQDAAKAELRSTMGTKAVIAAALLLLLGINLYSCFTNALDDRRFEIGIKRAVGASGWSIVWQFLYESLLVVLANIAVCVVLVGNVFVVYKYFAERTPDAFGNFPEWVVYISPYSIAMFLVCSLTLAVVFSLIFAYKSTRVEIVKYLKAE